MNKIQVLSSMIQGSECFKNANCVCLKVYVCIQIESCTESEREKRSGGRDSVSGSQKVKLREDLCFARVFD